MRFNPYNLDKTLIKVLRHKVAMEERGKHSILIIIQIF